MVKLVLRIHPIVNLFYHLERGGLSKRYIYAPVEEYRRRALKITDRILLDDFSFLLNQENIHSLIVRGIGESNSIEEAKENLVTALSTYAGEIAQLMGKSWPDYHQYFQDHAKPNLEKFRKKLQQLVPEIERTLIKVGNLSNLHWREDYTVYIVEPTSRDFKPCGGAIYGEGAVVEAHPDLKPKETTDLIIHELSHSDFDLMILRLVPENLRTDFEYVDEAIIFLIVNTALNYLKAPPKLEEYKDERSRKTAFYVTQFWEKWQKRIDSKGKQEIFEDFLTRLLGDKL